MRKFFNEEYAPTLKQHIVLIILNLALVLTAINILQKIQSKTPLMHLGMGFLAIASIIYMIAVVFSDMQRIKSFQWSILNKIFRYRKSNDTITDVSQEQNVTEVLPSDMEPTLIYLEKDEMSGVIHVDPNEFT